MFITNVLDRETGSSTTAIFAVGNPSMSHCFTGGKMKIKRTAFIATLLIVGMFAAPSLSAGEIAYAQKEDGSSTIKTSMKMGELAVTVPTPQAPTGTITDTTPTYKWTKISGATTYRYQLLKGTVTVYTKTIPSSACGTTTCTNTPTNVLSYAAHKWHVQAKVGGVWKAYSAYKTFTVSKPGVGFNSQFTSSATGWSVVKGDWGIISPGYYQTPGLAAYRSSVVHTGIYTALDYQARVKRTGCVKCANDLYIRGKTTPLDNNYYMWNSGYLFEYTNERYFSIWKIANGSYNTPLKNWTYYSGIKPNSWNTLRVTAKGSALKFYINGALVWSGSDSSLTNGQVGIGMYRDKFTSGNNFYVDWAKLGISVASLNNESLAETGNEILNWNNPNFSPAR
jgi:hypothetical protein